MKKYIVCIALIILSLIIAAPTCTKKECPEPYDMPLDHGKLGDLEFFDMSHVTFNKNSTVGIIGNSLFDTHNTTNHSIAHFLSMYINTGINSTAVVGSKITGERTCRPGIDTQFATIKAEMPNLQHIVIDGGANDFLAGDEGCICNTNEQPLCGTTAETVYSDIVSLLKTISTQITGKILFVGYANLGDEATKCAPYINTVMAKTKSLCESNEKYYFLDLTSYINTSMIDTDGLHLTWKANETISQVIYAYMAEYELITR